MQALVYYLYSVILMASIVTKPTPLVTPIIETAAVDLSGDWNVSGGRLNFNIRLVEDGYNLYWYNVSYTYGESSREVTEFDHSGSNVYIKLKEDVGLGKTTYTYNLTIQNSSTLTGTCDSYTASWNSLPPLRYHNKVTFRRQ